MATQGILEPLPCGFAEPFLWYQPRVAAQPNPSRNSRQELLSGIPSSVEINASLPDVVLPHFLEDFPATALLTSPSFSSPNLIRFET